ncbi:DDT domain-containing protein DDR4 [Forsythia ovata]|uniref:DDT domain-containing protein DDR4 n=1 Tax=Forsythia ovata TaxID=205694 RepID=A0ABD1W2E8_9LAMI
MTGGDAHNDDVIVISESSPTAVDVELARQKLRQRWELASVLNFLNVFEPMIQSNLKVSAEEIENALIEQNKLLAQLHKALLKGIHPVSKTMDSSDAWMIALSKKLLMWWPWVAEGDFPLNGAKGEEISIYKELDPTVRLLILKALCEVRADQDDIVSYINEAIKSGTEVSTFRKDKLDGDGHGTAFWYDGNATIGYRLYKEVHIFESKLRVNAKDTLPAIDSQWETLATNLEEFRKIVDELSSSEVKWEVSVSKTVEANAISVLEKLQKKKQRALQRQKREQMLLNGIRKAGITRSCRNLRTIDYRFDDYDRAIKEAIQYTNKRKTSGACYSDTDSRNSESTESDSEMNDHQGSDDVDDTNDDMRDGVKEDNDKKNGNKNNGTKQKISPAHRPKGFRSSKRLAGVPVPAIAEGLNLRAKNRSRQRPLINTAIESPIVPDSEDEELSRETSKRVSMNSFAVAATTSRD